jgi:ABC-type phosphate/phosphonate transport system substrate-binding protein
MAIAHAGTATTRRASLPMYNLPEMEPANAAFWNAIRVELRRQGVDDVPADLDFERRPVPERIEPGTLFTQVCGYPLQTIYRGQAVVLGAPVYAVEHCAGPTHAGVFIVHRDSAFRKLADLKGARFVFNSRHSNSGMNLPRRMIAEIAGGAAFFGSIAETHSHPGNIERIARGEADGTCVDCVTYAFFRRHRPQLVERTRILCPTRSTPSLPFVTAVATPDDLGARLRVALFNVGRSDEWTDVRAGLMLRDIVPVEMGSYAVQLQQEREAAELGYPELR